MSGQLGNGGTTDSADPILSGFVADAVHLALGNDHSCVIDTDENRIQCWGRNSDGQLGDGTTIRRLDPVATMITAEVQSAAAGEFHTCAVMMDRTVQCWGDNEDGRLGTGTTISSAVPVPVLGIDDATQVAAGKHFTCAVHAGDAVSCWGRNDNGPLGNGSMAGSLVPTPVALPSGS